MINWSQRYASLRKPKVLTDEHKAKLDVMAAELNAIPHRLTYIDKKTREPRISPRPSLTEKPRTRQHVIFYDNDTGEKTKGIYDFTYKWDDHVYGPDSMFGRPEDYDKYKLVSDHPEEWKKLKKKYKWDDPWMEPLKYTPTGMARADICAWSTNECNRSQFHLWSPELHYMVHNAPTENVPELSRGITLLSKKKQPEVSDLFKVGDIHYSHASSYTLDHEWAKDWAIAGSLGTIAGRWNPKKTMALPVVLHLPAKSQALQISPSTLRDYTYQQEYIAAEGHHRVTKIEQDEDGIHHVYLEQLKGHHD